MNTSFSLRNTFDWERLSGHYAAHGWVQIPNILARASADALFQILAAETQWNLSVGAGKQSWSIAPGGDARLPLEQAHTAAQQGFAYVFDHVPGLEADAPSALQPVKDLVASDAFVAMAQRITGDSDICFADAQASRYRPGHFLTIHDDNVAGKHRRAAYVLNLTPQWRPEWGGLLLFHDSSGGVTRGLVPAYNVLNIFRVPNPHSVSTVAPFAPAARYSVTGWFRTKPDA